MGFAPLWPGTIWDSVFLLALLHYATTLETHATDWRKKPPDLQIFYPGDHPIRRMGYSHNRDIFASTLRYCIFPFGVVSLQK